MSGNKGKESYDSILSEIFSNVTKDVYKGCKGIYVGRKDFFKGLSEVVSGLHCIPSLVNADDSERYIDDSTVKFVGKLTGFCGSVAFYTHYVASSHPECLLIPLFTNGLSLGYEKYCRPIKNRKIKEQQDEIKKQDNIEFKKWFNALKGKCYEMFPQV